MEEYFVFKRIKMYRLYVQAVTNVVLQSIISASLPLEREGDPSSFNDHQRLAYNFKTDTSMGLMSNFEAYSLYILE